MNLLKRYAEDCLGTLTVGGRRYTICRLAELEKRALADVRRLPYSIRILLENVLRHAREPYMTEEMLVELARWEPRDRRPVDIAYMPARVILQDFTGVPAVVDLAAMRSAMARWGGDPRAINPHVPVDLVIDHSVQIDFFGAADAYSRNVEKEFERNRERYTLLKWAQRSFRNFRVVPPGTGIVHQVNLEHLARVVQVRRQGRQTWAYPDTLLGTDSHTTMINGLGVFGWGVGGIEAEAVMLGQPYFMLIPDVIGVRLKGTLREGVTATDLVLAVTQTLRHFGVVGKFVEYFGPGVASLALPDRATLANMSPEYGATMGFFPVDEETLRYLKNTGRSPALVRLVREYTQAQQLFRRPEDPDPEYTAVVEIDMNAIEPAIAGPRNPEEKIPLREAKHAFLKHLESYYREREITAAKHEVSAHAQWQSEGGNQAHPCEAAEETEGRPRRFRVSHHHEEIRLGDGSVVIAAITSCTNTSNPSVMLGAGLLARNAVRFGLQTPPHVKTSLAPGSQIVVEYLRAAGVLPYLEALRFHLVGFGCTTCIGNSGPLPAWVGEAVDRYGLAVAAVLSGNRNFEGRIHPRVRFNYLASPMLVVAYALAGRMDIDFEREPLGEDPNGRAVYLKEIWPEAAEIREAIHTALKPSQFKKRYRDVFAGDENWQDLAAPAGTLYEWDPASTYIQEPPFFTLPSLDVPPLQDIVGARVLAFLGDGVTTDHISPAGAIPEQSPAGRYLIDRGVPPQEFNSFGSRRGNHEVMMRGTFGNIRLRNRLAQGREGGWTTHFPSGRLMTIYEASETYRQAGVPLIVLAGARYGTGSSRDWAAKGTLLLGVRAVLAKSFERIHRSNLVGMGVLPLQFEDGQGAKELGLEGNEVYTIQGVRDLTQPRSRVRVEARREDGTTLKFQAIVRLDAPIEIEYYRHGGILTMVLRRLLS